MSWPGTLPQPVLEGSSATYREVLPGVDLRVTASALGFSEVLVVKTPAAAANPALSQVRFGLATSEGLSVAAAGGGAEVRDKGGEVVFAAPAPLMWDSSGTLAEAERTALMPMAVTGGQLTIVPDTAMLSDPATKFPVYIDPSWSGGKYNNEWTTVWSKYPDSSFWRNTSALLNSSTYGAFGVGRVKDCDNCTTYRIRTLFRMDARGVRGKQIRNAKLRMQQRWSWTCSPSSGARVWSMGSLINSSTTWNNQPAWGAASAVVAANHKVGAVSGCLNVGDVEFDVTGIVAASAPSANTVVFGMRAVDESTVNQWKRYWHDSPRLVVEYNTVPTTPVAADLAERAESTSPDLPCATGTSRPLVRSALPWLRAKLRDPDGPNGGKLKGTFQWQQWNGTAWVAMTGSPKASGLVAPDEVATVQITSGLVDGGRYRWQVQTADTLGGSSQWSPWCEFQVESAPPGARPGVAPADGLYLESPGNTARRGGVGKSGRFTLSASGVPDVVDYVYKLENGPERVATAAAPGGSVTVWATPTHVDENVLHVWSRDAAGNRSPSYDYWFRVDVAAAPVAHWELNEGSGTTLASAGAGPTATLTTATGAWTEGRIIGGGSALNLDGSTVSAQTAAPVVATDRAFSVAAWVRLDSITGYHEAVSQDGPLNSVFRLEYRTDVTKWCFSAVRADGVLSQACAAAPVRTGVWTHLAGVWDPGAGTIALYVNGTKDGELAVASMAPSSGPLAIGRRLLDGAPASRWRGAIDDVRVWDRVAYPDLDLAPITEPARVGAWDLEDWAPVAADSSGYGHDGTLTPEPSAQWTPDGYNFSSAVAFDGMSGHIATAGPVLRTDQSFTVSAWVRLAALPSAARTVLGQDGAYKSGFFLGARMVGGVPKWCFLMHNLDLDVDGSVNSSGPEITEFDVGRWVHLVGVFDAQAQQLRLYVDGQPAPATTRTVRWQAGGGFTIARARWTPPGGTPMDVDRFPGTVDKARAYAGALTDTQVVDLLLNEP